MADRKPLAILRQVREMVRQQNFDPPGDRQLIDRFVRYREVSAFDVLYQRHGPMVLRICRRILSDRHAAEDAAQATFLVLVRKAASIRKRQSLAGWLYRVAVRIAVRASSDSGKSHAHVAPVSPRREFDPAGEASHRELCAILDEEVLRLPERFRTPVLLCYVEGLTRDQSALQLGWSLRTLQRRLEQGRELLRRRLTRRGATLSSALLAADLLEPRTEAGATAPIFQASQVPGAASSVSARAAFLTDRFIRSIAMTQIKRLGAVILAVTVFAATAGVAAYAKWPDPAPKAEAPQPPANDGAKPEPKPPQIPAFLYGVVQDERAKPVARARIWLREGTMPLFHFRALDADDQGRFSVNLTEPSFVSLVALARGFSFAGRQLTIPEGQPAQKVVLTLNSPEDLRLRVLNEVGQPIQGAELNSIAWKTERTDLFWLPPEVLANEGITKPVSDKDGLIILSGIPKGATCQGCVKHADFARKMFDGIEAGKAPVEMKLTLGHALTIIAMNGATKKPAPGTVVQLWAREFGNAFETTTDREGRATIRLAEARDVNIRFSHPQLMSPRQVDVPRWSAVSGTILEMELFPKVKVTGRCVDERTGQPVAGPPSKTILPRLAQVRG